MAKFEVYIPASDTNGFNVTLKVGADNWMAALKAGMQKLGEQGAVSQNVMVDIQEDNSVHVTDTASGRVFRIRELTEAEAQKALVKKPTQQSLPAVPAPVAPPPAPPPSAPPPAAAPVAAPAPTFAARGDAITEVGPARVIEPVTQPPAPAKLSDTSPGTPAFDSNKTVLNIAPSQSSAPPSRAGTQPTPIPAGPLKHTTGQIQLKDVEEIEQPVKPTTGSIGRPKTKPVPAVTSRSQAEDMLSDIFLRVAELNSRNDIAEAMEFILDLAMEKVPCESGAVLRADGATGDLTFLTARGPKAKELLKSKIVVPAGEGIAGFCSAEGVAVALSDVKKDGRFYSGVGDRVEYETKSILCAPMMTHGMSFGCVQLINRKGNSTTWAEHETGVLTYLAHQAALFLNRKLLE